MADVSVNIRGRDDGFGNMLDSLREKATSFGRDVNTIGEEFNNLTKTEKRIEIERVNSETTNTRKQSVRDEYKSLREENAREFAEASDDYSSGRISKREFNQHKRTFEKVSEEMDTAEANELVAIEKESNAFLKEILKTLTLQERLESERRQRDVSEFAPGSIGALTASNRDLRSLQNRSTDEDEIAALQDEIDANNQTIRDMRRGEDDDDGGGGGRGIGRGLSSTAGAAARGDLSGTIVSGAGMAGGIAAGVAVAGIALKEFLSQDDKIREAIASTSAMRGGSGFAGAGSSRAFVKGINNIDELSGLGLSGDQFAQMVNQKAMASGMAGNDVLGRTLQDVQFQKGFGADAGIFSQFERFNEGQKTSTEIALDVLNVLTSIDKSSLKEGDLSTLTEKLASQNAILSFQRNKRDFVDSDSALKTLAAYEKAGLSAKGEMGGAFLNQTMQGLGEGGGDNAMLFKYEAAKRARPDLANDPAALRRFVRFHADDPKYQSEFFKFAKQVSGGSQMAEDDILYTLFNPQSEADMDIYKNMLENRGGARGDLTKKLDKTRKATLGIDTMAIDAKATTGDITAVEKAFRNVITEASTDLKEFFKTNIFNMNDKTVRPQRPNVAKKGK